MAHYTVHQYGSVTDGSRLVARIVHTMNGRQFLMKLAPQGYDGPTIMRGGHKLIEDYSRDVQKICSDPRKINAVVDELLSS